VKNRGASLCAIARADATAINAATISARAENRFTAASS
jgi:hypothetical protein